MPGADNEAFDWRARVRARISICLPRLRLSDPPGQDMMQAAQHRSLARPRVSLRAAPRPLPARPRPAPACHALPAPLLLLQSSLQHQPLGLEVATVAGSAVAAVSVLALATRLPYLSAAQRVFTTEAGKLQASLPGRAVNQTLLFFLLSHPLRAFVLVSASASLLTLLLPAGAGAIAAAWRLSSALLATWVAMCVQQATFALEANLDPRSAHTWKELSRLFKHALAVVGTVLAFRYAGVPLGPLVALGGVGGLTLGLAVQAAASNVVAGATLLVESAFLVDEKIEVGKNGLVGWVTRFGLASTEIMAEDTTPVTIPNGEMAKQTIRNFTRRSHWTVAATFRLPHAHLASVRAIAEDMEAYLRGRPDFSEAPPRLVCRVVLGDIGADALPLHVTAFVSSKGVILAEFERIKSRILCDLGDIVTVKHGAPLALPSSNVRMEAAGAAAAPGGAAWGAAAEN